MANFDTLVGNLKSRGFLVSQFDKAAEAVSYLNEQIDKTTVAFGGSITLQEIGLYDALATHNDVCWHWKEGGLEKAMATDVYISSANAISEAGEIINIDGNGNRVASTIYGHKKVYFVIGKNKIEPDFEKALWRARNIAAPKNAQRLNMNTPCAIKVDKCYDCNSPQRICKSLVVLWGPQSSGNCDIEVVLVNEELGY